VSFRWPGVTCTAPRHVVRRNYRGLGEARILCLLTYLSSPVRRPMLVHGDEHTLCVQCTGRNLNVTTTERTGNAMQPGEMARSVRTYIIDSERDFDRLREDWEHIVPAFSRDDAIKVVTSGGDWAAIEALTQTSAPHGLVNFFAFDPSPVFRLAGNTLRAVTYLASSIPLGESVFRHDPAAIHYAPMRVTLAERAGESAVLLVDKPADLLGVFADVEAASAVFESRLADVLVLLGLAVPAGLAAMP
jgi:hypothetical protein